jgi:5-oxoprolinase (ATP-hydrolysing)
MSEAGGGAASHLGIDIGGTFTDVLERRADGTVRVEKRLSTPDDYSLAIANAIEDVAELGSPRIGLLAHATTIATNAILEATGGRVGLITTAGFRDVLELGRLQRSELYDLTWDKWPPLVPRRRRVEVVERIAGDGSVVTPLELDSVAAALDALLAQDVTAVAICLINSYVNPVHEHSVTACVRERAPRLPVVASVALQRDIGEFERASTAAVNAYLMPVVSSYLKTLSGRLRDHDVKVAPRIMQSSGGTMSIEAAARMPVRMIESGPAAGVKAAAALAEQMGIRHAISFDMGGTTAKACLIEDCRPSICDEYWVGSGINREGSRLLRGSGYAVRTATMDIAEVSSGGGSIAWIDDGGALKVGPRSAGASPGPACYGLGGTLPTFTDACVVLGILGRSTIGVDELRLDRALAEDAIRRHVAGPLGISVSRAARDIYEVGISNLTRAVRAVTTDVGNDASEFTLIAFGGGGGMVAARLALKLGIRHVIVPPIPGVFSAVGLLVAPVRRDAVHGVFRPFTLAAVETARGIAAALELQLIDEMHAEGQDGSFEVTCRIDVCYRGQAASMSIDWTDHADDDVARSHDAIRSAFLREYEALHGYVRTAEEMELVAVRVTVEAARSVLRHGELVQRGELAPSGPPTSRTLIDLDDGRDLDAVVVAARTAIPVGRHDQDIVIDEPDATIFVPRSLDVEVDRLGAVHLWPRGDRERAPVSGEPDASSLEIFKNWLGTVNDEVTAVIARTAQSEIAKDTLDFASAICDARGRVVSQGLTVVLHAGSIPDAITMLLERHGDEMQPGDVFLSNDPYLAGGSHLPDLYVIKPIFAEGEHVAFAGTVCHVADIGGRVPGGNAADSREIYEEGLRLPFVRIVRNGRRSIELEELLAANVRVPDKVLGDLHALIVACEIADRRIQELVSARGRSYLAAHIDAVIGHAARLFKERLRAFPAGRVGFSDVIDDDGLGSGPITVHVEIERQGDRLVVDFSGSDPQAEGATNSPLCFTRSAVFYAAKAILGPDIPDNSGYFELVDVHAPPGLVVNPIEPSATGAKGVVAFRIVDTLFGAFAEAVPALVPAAGDGGSTVVVFGGRNEGRAFVLVDVISSAWGGRPGKDGIDGISSPPSNGRNTPIEVIEGSYPIRVEEYSLVADSGGPGRFRGGMASRRRYRYLGSEPSTLQVRADRNPTRPWGLLGGHDGWTSTNSVEVRGHARELPTKPTIRIECRTRFEHRTASGAGYGDPHERAAAAVLADVLDQKISVESAARHYGVVVSGGRVDAPATAALRARPNEISARTANHVGAPR